MPAPGFRTAMGTGEGAALLLALRRGSGHLYYPASGRGYWVPIREVRAIPDGAVPAGSCEALLSGVVRYLAADEVDIEGGLGGRARLTLDLPGLTHAQLRGLEGILGPWLKDLTAEPGGRHALTLRLELTGLPPAHGAGI